MKWSAPIQQVTRGRKGLTSQSASRSSLSLPSSKVGSVLLSRTALTPDPGLWPQGLPPFNSFLFTCPGSLAANLTYTLQLDGHRTRSRGLFPGGRHELNGNTAVTLAKFCLEYWFHFPVREPAKLLWEVKGDELTTGRGGCAQLFRCPAWS